MKAARNALRPADGPARPKHGWRRHVASASRRSGGLAALLVGTAVALSACSPGSGSPSGTAPPTVASLGASNGATDGNGGGSSPSTGAGGSTATTAGGRSSATAPGAAHATQLLNEWAACMRTHGDPTQADPVVDAYGVINITMQNVSASLANEVHGGGGPCDSYLSAASNALAAADPVAPPPDYAALVRYTDCMRTHGVPNYPDPGSSPEVNFNGTGVDLNSPVVENAGKVCSRQIGAPAWWISGNGRPGEISVTSCNGSATFCSGPPRSGANRPASGGAGSNGGAAGSG